MKASDNWKTLEVTQTTIDGYLHTGKSDVIVIFMHCNVQQASTIMHMQKIQ